VRPDDRRDRKLAKLFLAHLHERRRRHWTSLDFPEDRIRSKQAVQVIAMEDTGRTTAIEHSRLDWFAEDAEELRRVLAIFSPIEHDPSLRVAGCHVDIAVPMGVLPTAVDRKVLVNGVRGWCARNVASAPEGESTHVITLAGMTLKIHVEKASCPGEPGRLAIVSSDPPRNFEAVVRDRLRRTLETLVSAPADQHVLLFEKSDVLWSAGQLRRELEGARLEFPDLNRVDEVWMVDTVCWEIEKYVGFRLVLRAQDNMTIEQP
jgi:hypothetical protein